MLGGVAALPSTHSVLQVGKKAHCHSVEIAEIYSHHVFAKISKFSTELVLRKPWEINYIGNFYNELNGLLFKLMGFFFVKFKMMKMK